MSLLSTDITKVKRLSVKDIKLPAPGEDKETVKPIQVEGPPTDEEIIYSKLVDKNSTLENLVDKFSLVSSITGEQIKRVEITEGFKPHPAPEEKTKANSTKLKDIAKKLLEEGNSYSREEIIEGIIKDTKVSQERAERGFNLMLQTGAIKKATNLEVYYLKGSTPF